MRKATQEQLDAIQTPEYQARLQGLVAEPGQKTLAHRFFPANYFGSAKGPLTPMELRFLKNHTKPLSSDWESTNLWEEGDEVSSAYGNLTLRGLIVWKLRTGTKGTWLVSEITDQGKALLDIGTITG